jgi:hypothetical protein
MFTEIDHAFQDFQNISQATNWHGPIVVGEKGTEKAELQTHKGGHDEWGDEKNTGLRVGYCRAPAYRA